MFWITIEPDNCSLKIITLQNTISLKRRSLLLADFKMKPIDCLIFKCWCYMKKKNADIICCKIALVLLKIVLKKRIGRNLQWTKFRQLLQMVVSTLKITTLRIEVPLLKLNKRSWQSWCYINVAPSSTCL
jgi:hypothetical protein